ncbi:MAG: aminopeptidase [Promethearchaeota archaeon]
MINPFYKKLARLIVYYSIGVKKGEKVWIVGPILAQELFQALHIEILKAGGHPYITAALEGINEALFKYANDDQLEHVFNFEKNMREEFDAFIWIDADYNKKKLSSVNPRHLLKYYSSPSRKGLSKILDERSSKGELRYVGCPFPCNALAQEANMDLFSYTEFLNKLLFLDKEDPIQEWQKVEKQQNKLVEYLNQVKTIQVKGEDTDLNLSVKGRKWINYCGKLNLPDGELCTGPIEDSVNGHIRFTYPGIYMWKEIKNIYLEFEDGVVINGSADKGEELLQEILKIENANRLGEFAIGTNESITQFTKNMLFDEKMGGTIHCALGKGYKTTGSTNESTIHWDILKDMKPPGSKIIADDKVIYEEGNWKI